MQYVYKDATRHYLSASTKGSDIVVLQISSNGPSINYFVGKRKGYSNCTKTHFSITDTVSAFIKDSQIEYIFESPPNLKNYKK